MADTEIRWTKEFPTEDGDYLCRINEHDLSPVSFRLENGAIYEYGCGKNLRSDYHHHAAEYEFLGPLTWRDFEQLLRLRKAAEAARAWICRVSNQYMFGADDPHEALTLLREALEPEALAQRQGEQS